MVAASNNSCCRVEHKGRSKSAEKKLPAPGLDKTHCHYKGNTSTVCSKYIARDEWSNNSGSPSRTESGRIELPGSDQSSYQHKFSNSLNQRKRQEKRTQVK